MADIDRCISCGEYVPEGKAFCRKCEEKARTMERYFVLKDNKIEASTATRDAAINLIRVYQSQETHQFLKAEFSIIKGEQEFVPYKTK